MGRWFSSLTQQSRLLRGSRGARRRVRTRRESLETLEARVLLAGDLVAHWRADTLNDAHADGQVVSSWIDSSGGSQAVAAGAPVLAKDVWSGRSVGAPRCGRWGGLISRRAG